MLLSSILAAVCIGYAGATITTCALAKGNCDSEKFVWCEESATRTKTIIPTFGTKKPDKVADCTNNDGTGLTIESLKCYDACPVDTKYRVGCFKKGGNKWVPVQRTIDENSSNVNNAATASTALAGTNHC